MAWVYEQKFNDLNTAVLHGQDSWVEDSGTGWSVQEIYAAEGAKAAKGASAAGYIRRVIASVSEGVVYISMLKTNVSTHQGNFYFSDGGGNDLWIRNQTNDIDVVDGFAKIELKGDCLADTWYRVGLDFDCSTDTYQANIDNGAWSPTYDFETAADPGISEIWLRSVAGDCYIDYISTNYEDVPVGNNPVKDVGKFLSESAMAMADAKAISPGVGLSDSVALTDAGIVKGTGKNITDTVTIADALARAIGKVLSETLTLADNISNGVGKIIAEAAHKIEDKIAFAGTAWDRLTFIVKEKLFKKKDIGNYSARSDYNKKLKQ